MGRFIGAGLVSLAIFMVIIGKGRRILQVNRFLIPLLIILTLIVSIRVALNYDRFLAVNYQFEILNPSPLLTNWVFSVLLYLGYNIIGAVVAIINIGKEVNPKEGQIGGWMGGLIVAFLGTLLIFTLWSTYPIWKDADLPIVAVLQAQFSWLYPVFVPAMLIAMFTVATAYALGFSKFISIKYKIPFNFSCAGLLVITFPISLLGFSHLLGLIYPFFGIMATIIFIFLVGRTVIRSYNQRKKSHFLKIGSS